MNVSGLAGNTAAQVKSSYALATRLPPPIPDRAHTAFVSAMHIALLSASGAALVAAIGVVILLSRRRQPVPAHEPEALPAVPKPGP